MKETILYISKSEQDVKSFLKYLQRKLEAEQKECILDEKRNILTMPKYYDIVGKSIYGNRLGTGYGYCKYYCFSEAYDKDKYRDSEKEKIEEILTHTRQGAKEISGLDIISLKVGGAMNDFLKFFDEKAKDFPMHLEITYGKMCDWNILIYKKGCADYYPKAKHSGEDVIIVNENDCDMELCFAKAHVKLKEWLLKFNSGY